MRNVGISVPSGDGMAAGFRKDWRSTSQSLAACLGAREQSTSLWLLLAKTQRRLFAVRICVRETTLFVAVFGTDSPQRQHIADHLSRHAGLRRLRGEVAPNLRVDN